MQLLVRNTVKDFSRWLACFEADSRAAAEYGVTFECMWQAAGNPNEVFFLLNIESAERAEAFMARPESQDTGEKAGVIDGEVHFLKPVDYSM